MPFDITSLIPVYQGGIDSLILNLGKPVTCFFAPTIENLQSDTYDPIRGRQTKSSSYNTQNKTQKESLNYTTKVVTCLVDFAGTLDNDSVNRTLEFGGRLQLKGFLTDLPVLKRADHIKVDIGITPYIDSKYKMVSEPIPVGLRYNRYVITIWERA